MYLVLLCYYWYYLCYYVLMVNLDPRVCTSILGIALVHRSVCCPYLWYLGLVPNTCTLLFMHIARLVIVNRDNDIEIAEDNTGGDRVTQNPPVPSFDKTHVMTSSPTYLQHVNYFQNNV